MRVVALVAVGLLLPGLWLAACAGGSDPEPTVGGLRLVIHESTAERFRATVHFGPPKFVTLEESGETFTNVESEGCHPGGNDGQPGVPILTRLLAVPQGARALVSETNAVVSQRRTLLLHPFQKMEGEYSPAFETPDPFPVAEKSWKPPFAYDRIAYAGTDLYPPDPVQCSPESSARDLSIVVLQVAAGEYAPATQMLTLYSQVDLTIEFEGSQGEFLANRAGNPFEEGSRTARASTWNHAAVRDVGAFSKIPFPVFGEELLILTHPDYEDAALRLAAHKNGRGLATSVVVVNDGVGGGPDTKEEIKAFLDARWDSALVRYSYLLLIGDAADIAPWVLPRRYKEGEFPSDFPYAQVHTDSMDDDLIPEVAVGRIPVETLDEADVVVDKIIQYESNPPLILPGGTFYGHAAIASYFQPGQDGNPPYEENLRRFIQDSEEVRGHLVSNFFDVERIYTADHPLTDDNRPRYYRDGVTPLPFPLRFEDNYPWDGDTQQVIDAFNSGKTLYFHVDHGWGGGWGDPYFSTAHLGSLTNGELLPLVLSDNCSSGAFDYAAGFAEEILRMSGGGAIGVIAFTRNSNNGVGRQFLIGVVDALFPSAYPTIGDSQARHRLGDMLNHARSVITLDDVGADPTTDKYLGAWCYTRMLTLFGDPTLAPWLENPNPLPVSGDQFVAGPAIDLVYPLQGATITIFEQLADGLAPIGRGTAGPGGAVRIVPIVDVGNVQNLKFFASAPGAVPMEITVPVGGP